MRAIIKKIEVPIEPGKKNSKAIEKKVRVFGDSATSPEAWVKWRIELEDIIRDHPLKTGEHKASMALALLKGSPTDTVDSGHREHREAGRREERQK